MSQAVSDLILVVLRCYAVLQSSMLIPVLFFIGSGYAGGKQRGGGRNQRHQPY